MTTVEKEKEKGDYQNFADSGDQSKVTCWKRCFPKGYRAELKELIALTGPLIITNLSQFIIGPISIMFCGHLGELALASVALANSFINVTCLAIGNGIAVACDTLFSQVYGSKNRKRMGIILQRSIMILLMAVFPCWTIHINMEAILRWFHQDPLISRITADYLLHFLPGVVFYFMYLGLSKYLQNQNIVIPNVIIGAIANIINAVLHYLFLFVFKVGLMGSAIAQVIAYFSMFFLTLMYIIISKVYKETWNGFSAEAFDDWAEFILMGAFGLVMICVETWSFEIGTITSGLLGTKYLAAMSVIFQLETFAYMLPFSNGIAAGIRVGQYLGAGDDKGAQTAARVALTSICFFELGVALIFIVLREYLPLIFTNVPEVIALVTSVLPICAVYQISDGLAGTGMGILRGQGRQNLAAGIVVIGYAFALGAGTPLMLYTWLRLHAYWGGLATALTIEGILCALVIHFNDWEKQAKDALVRAKVETEEVVVITEEGEKQPLVNGSKLDQNSTESTGSYVFDRSRLPGILVKRAILLLFVLAIFVAGVLFRVFYTDKLVIDHSDFFVWVNGTLEAEHYLPEYHYSQYANATGLHFKHVYAQFGNLTGHHWAHALSGHGLHQGAGQ